MMESLTDFTETAENWNLHAATGFPAWKELFHRCNRKIYGPFFVRRALRTVEKPHFMRMATKHASGSISHGAVIVRRDSNEHKLRNSRSARLRCFI